MFNVNYSYLMINTNNNNNINNRNKAFPSHFHPLTRIQVISYPKKLCQILLNIIIFLIQNCV